MAPRSVSSDVVPSLPVTAFVNVSVIPMDRERILIVWGMNASYSRDPESVDLYLRRGTTAGRPQDAAVAIPAYKAAGYDFIKIHDEDTETFDSVAAAARLHFWRFGAA